MKITKVWEQHPGEILAYCVGDDINSHFACKKISVAGKEFDVSNAGSSMAFCGRMNAIMSLIVDDPAEVPLGEFKILQ